MQLDLIVHSGDGPFLEATVAAVFVLVAVVGYMVLLSLRNDVHSPSIRQATEQD